MTGPVGAIELPNGAVLSPEQVKYMTWGDAELFASWFAKLPGTIERACHQWNVTLLPEMPRLSLNLVLFGETPEHGPVAMKLAPPNFEVDAELEALRIAHPETLIAADPRLAGSLQRRVLPGTLLRHMMERGELSDTEATEILGHLIKKYWRRIPANHLLHPLPRWLGSVFTYRDAYLPGVDRIPADHVELAADTLEDLLAHPTDQVMLHGDLHHDNVLRDDRAGWTVIDPKGLIGEPGFDVCALMFNPFGWDRWDNHEEVTNRRLTQLSDILGINRYRLWQWTFVFSVQNSIWRLKFDADADLFPQSIGEILLAMPEAKR